MDSKTCLVEEVNFLLGPVRVKMNAVESVKVLRMHAMKTEDSPVREAIGTLLDHLCRMEQYADLVSNAMESANRDRPKNAVLGVR